MLTYNILWQNARKGGKAMKYCEIKDNGISITLPKSIERLEKVILASALDYGAFGDVKGTSVDGKNGNYRHIVVTFPEKAEKCAMEAFAEKVDAAIEELVEENA